MVECRHHLFFLTLLPFQKCLQVSRVLVIWLCPRTPSGLHSRFVDKLLGNRVRYRLVQIERPKLCPRLMTNAIPNQYAQIWYRRKAQEKTKRVTWLDFRVRRWAWRCGRKQVSANQNPWKMASSAAFL